MHAQRRVVEPDEGIGPGGSELAIGLTPCFQHSLTSLVRLLYRCLLDVHGLSVCLPLLVCTHKQRRVLDGLSARIRDMKL